IIGTRTPNFSIVSTILGTARAASSVLTVTRTSSEPAWASAITWFTVDITSAVSVLVIDCTTMGWSPPTVTDPILTAAERRRGDGPICVDMILILIVNWRSAFPDRATRSARRPMPSSRKDIASRSRELKKELGLGNLVLTQILFVMGLSWVGTAAKLGASHVMFWLLAAGLFYVPSAVVVVHLSRKYPLEGGLYQWAKIGFGERTGFLVAWNLWIYAMILMSSIGVQTAANLAY